jgi:hypothetical protein
LSRGTRHRQPCPEQVTIKRRGEGDPMADEKKPDFLIIWGDDIG